MWPLVVLACLRIGRGSTRAADLRCRHRRHRGIDLPMAALPPAATRRARTTAPTRERTRSSSARCSAAPARRSGRRERGARCAIDRGSRARRRAAIAWMLHVTSGEPARTTTGAARCVFAVAVAVLIAGAAASRSGRTRSCSRWRPLVWIGRISYGLYLWHWPVERVRDRSRVGLRRRRAQGVRLASRSRARSLSYYLVEMPIRRGSISVAHRAAPRAGRDRGDGRGDRARRPTAAAPLPSYLGGGAAAGGRVCAAHGAGPHRAIGRRRHQARQRRADDDRDLSLSRSRRATESSAASAAVAGERIASRARGPGVRCACSSSATRRVQRRGRARARRRARRSKSAQAAVLGCGVVSGEVWDADEPFPKSTEHCHSVVPRGTTGHRRLPSGGRALGQHVGALQSRRPRGRVPNGKRAVEAAARAPTRRRLPAADRRRRAPRRRDDRGTGPGRAAPGQESVEHQVRPALRRAERAARGVRGPPSRPA